MCVCYSAGGRTQIAPGCEEHAALLSVIEPFYTLECRSCGSDRKDTHFDDCRFVNGGRVQAEPDEALAAYEAIQPCPE